MDKVLIVGADAELLKRLRKELGRFVGQFEVLTAADAAAALETLQKERISVLVTDLEAPSADRTDLLAHMRWHRPYVPCIALTEQPEAVSLDSPEREHIVGSIAKPVETKALFALIMEGLERIDEGVFWREYRSH